MTRPVLLSEVEASLVLSNWTAIDGLFDKGDIVALWDLLIPSRRDALYQALAPYDKAPSHDKVAACIRVVVPRRRAR